MGDPIYAPRPLIPFSDEAEEEVEERRLRKRGKAQRRVATRSQCGIRFVRCGGGRMVIRRGKHV